MYSFTIAVTLASLLSLATAIPTAANTPRTCGTGIFPSFLQQLTEANPTTVNPNTITTGHATQGDFHVSQTVDASGAVSNRIYQVVAFENIPAGAYGCQLNWAIPADPNAVPLNSTGNPTLSVYTLFNDNSAAITYPNNWSWNTFFPATSPPFGLGTFGTANIVYGGSGVINSEACPVGGGNLAFVSEIANWVSQSSSIEFIAFVNSFSGAGLTGPYLTYNC